MQQASESADAKRRAKFLIGGGVILLSLVALVAWAMTRPNSTSFFYTPSEVVELPLAQGAEEYRVNGKVVPDSVDRDGLTTTFDISDGSTALSLTTDQSLPDAFWTAMANDSSEVEVVARGRYDGTTFLASEVLAKCPSKFKAKVAA
jgi:cytochrome c-type biogenesis protein CcmE